MWALWDRVPRSRAVAILALGALASLALVSSTLVLLGAATVIIAGVALWDTSRIVTPRADRWPGGRIGDP